MQQYIVTGMSCAACSARVEKAVNAVPGVTSCSVSLLTNSMGVEGNAAEDTIIEAVQNAGYGAKIKGAGVQSRPRAGTQNPRPSPSRTTYMRLCTATSITSSFCRTPQSRRKASLQTSRTNWRKTRLCERTSAS